MDDFAGLQSALPDALAANTVGSGRDHVMIALPSFSLGESLLSHYGDRIPALEHRYLLALLVLHRIACDLVLVVSQAPTPEVLDYYLSLIPAESASARGACTSWRSRRHPPLDRREAARPSRSDPGGADPDRREAGLHRAVERHRARGGRRRAAGRADQRHRRLGCGRWASRATVGACSARRGSPSPPVVRTCAPSTTSSRRRRPRGEAVRPGVASSKHDDSGAGDGNQGRLASRRRPPRRPLRRHRPALPWYLHDLADGGVVEELVTGTRFTTRASRSTSSPMAGWWCWPPTSRSWAVRPARCTWAVASRPTPPTSPTSRATVEPSVSGSPTAGCSARQHRLRRPDAAGRWHLHALEVNLRKGGTTHPYAVLRNVAPGRYDEEAVAG